MFGAQCLLTGWMLYVTLLWVLKACMLCFYNRLTYVGLPHSRTWLTKGSLGLAQQKFVKYAAGFCFCTYIATIMTILLRCTPLDRLWQIYPDPGRELSAFKHSLLLTASRELYPSHHKLHCRCSNQCLVGLEATGDAGQDC